MKRAFVFSMPHILYAAFFLCLSGTAAFAGISESTECPGGDAIIIASIGDARNLVPILATDSASGEICSLVFNGLVKYDKDLRVTGDLAQSWEILDEGRVIVFHLKRGVRWHDGAPFTAGDVEFTFRKLIDPLVKTPYSGDFERIQSLEVIDDYTLKVTYKEPFAPALSSWGMPIMPKHLLEHEDLNTTRFSRNPVGTGPYKFLRWKTGEKIELVFNQDYFEGRPRIDRSIYRIIPDTSTIFLELQAETVDMAQLTPLEYSRQTDTPFFKRMYQKFRYPSFGYTYMGYNLADKRFQDKRVRQAIDRAIDKNEIINGVLFGLGRPCTGPFPPESWAHNRDLAVTPYDRRAAVRLLEEAGWGDSNSDGWLEKDGKKFEFTVITNQGNLERLRSAEIIQKRLKDVGIDMKIKVLEWSAFLEFINRRNFEACLLGWSLSRDPDCFDIWHSSKTREGEFNFVGYRNEEVDRLLEEARRTFDQDKRKALYNRVHAIIYDEQPYLFLYVPDSLPIVHKRFRGIEVAPIGIGHNFTKWYVPVKEQKYRFTQ